MNFISKTLSLVLLLSNICAVAQEEQCIPNVASSIKRIKTKGSSMKIHTKNFFEKDEYTSRMQNLFGFNNHFQGVAYDEANKSFIISGGDVKKLQGDLIVTKKEGFREHSVSQRIHTAGDRSHWHAGGVTIRDNTLIVPVETLNKENGTAEVYFYDLSKGKTLVLMDTKITLDHQKTGSVDITFNAKEKRYYLFAFSTDMFTIYKSYSNKISDGFELDRIVETNFYSGSNVKVLKQCDGELFFADLSGKLLFSRFFRKKDYIKLYKYDFKTTNLEFMFQENFKCKGKCKFRGASNIIIRNQKPIILATKIFKESKKDLLYLSTFSE